MRSTLQENFNHLDRELLRPLVATIDREMRELAGSPNSRSTDALRSSWAELVALLEMGPSPEVRECPVCKRLGMRDARRCGYCWTALAPLASCAATGPRV